MECESGELSLSRSKQSRQSFISAIPESGVPVGVSKAAASAADSKWDDPGLGAGAVCWGLVA
jgi:hypothetical protein